MSVRKIKNNKKRNAFRIWLCLFGLFFMSLTACGVASFGVLFGVEKVRVEGDTIYSKEDIIAGSHISFGSNLFLLDKKKTANLITKNLPYIDSVEVVKCMPSDVLLKVKSSSVFALVENDERPFLINNRYKVLEFAEGPNPDFCNIKGARVKNIEVGESLVFEDENQMKTLKDLSLKLEEYSIIPTQIDISNISEVIFYYDARIKVILGVPEKLDYKIKTASFILENEISPKERGTLDLSYIVENEKTYFTPENESTL